MDVVQVHTGLLHRTIFTRAEGDTVNTVFTSDIDKQLSSPTMVRSLSVYLLPVVVKARLATQWRHEG